MLVGLFILLGIEKVIPSPNFKPLGLEFVSADYSHSMSMILIWSFIWAWLTSYLSKSNKTITATTYQISFYAFLSVLIHTLADWMVHLPDMALYPSSKIKLGSKLWGYAPISAWGLELAIVILSLALIYYYYGSSITFPALLLVSMHLMNYPGAPTNIPYMMGNYLKGNMLRYAVGIAFIMTYALPCWLLCNNLDNSTTIRRKSSFKSQ